MSAGGSFKRVWVRVSLQLPMGYPCYSLVMVDVDQKKQRSHNVIFVEGIAHRQIKDAPSTFEFPKQESAHIEEVTEAEAESEVEAEESRRRRTRSEVWGTDPTR